MYCEIRSARTVRLVKPRTCTTALSVVVKHQLLEVLIPDETNTSEESVIINFGKEAPRTSRNNSQDWLRRQ